MWNWWRVAVRKGLVQELGTGRVRDRTNHSKPIRPDASRRGAFARALLGIAALGGLWRPVAAAPTPVVMVLGDSLSAEYGIARDAGWVALMAQRLQGRARVVNVSVSGETTAGGRSRLGALLAQHRPQVVVIELGGNDALRGLPIETTKDNLRSMIRQSRQAGARVLLVGMQIPPNYGARYAREFSEVFAVVAQAERVPLVPFLLAGVADRPDAREWFQGDGIHPLAKAHPVMLGNVWPALKPLIP